MYKCSCLSWSEVNSWDGRVVMGTGPLEGIVTILLAEPHVSSSFGVFRKPFYKFTCSNPFNGVASIS